MYVCWDPLFVIHHARQQPSGRVRESLNACKLFLFPRRQKSRKQDNAVVNDRPCVHSSSGEAIHTYNEYWALLWYQICRHWWLVIG